MMPNKVTSMLVLCLIWTLFFVSQGYAGSEKFYVSLFHEGSTISTIQLYSSVIEIQKDLDKIHQEDVRQLEKAW